MTSRTRFTVVLCMSLAFLGCGTNRNADLQSLQGTWKLVYQQIDGKKLPDEKMAREFNGNATFVGREIHYTAELQGFDFQFHFRLRPGHIPKEIDLQLMNPTGERAVSLLGIYRLSDDHLDICFNRTTRPAEFTAGDGSNNTLIVLRREPEQQGQSFFPAGEKP